MNREQLRGKLQLMMKEKFRIQTDSMEDHIQLNEDLRIDSIMIVQLIVYIEMDIGLQVPDESIDPRIFATIGSVLDFMMELEPLPECESDLLIEAGDGA